MLAQRKADLSANRVELSESSGQWVVKVHMDGDETVSSFELESFARSFAEGQRLRLGLDGFERI